MVLLLATACGEPSKPVEPVEPPSCGPMTCDGCCNAGTCEPGTTALACGLGGAACSACGAGESCQEGTCEAPSQPSDAGTDDAGTPDSGTPDAGPQQTVILFDPRSMSPVVPEPNDLRMDPATGLVRYPISPGDSPAQQEFTRDYLNTLDGFPGSVTASAQTSAPLDPFSVNSQSVRLIQVAGPAMSTAPIVGYNEDTLKILVIAPTGWPRGARFMVAVLGGDSGVKDVGGRHVAGSPVWQWVRSTTPLVDDSDRSTVPGLPDADAPNMERLRLRYAPHLDQLASQGVRREDVVALWTFTVSSRPQVTFDPWDRSAPFPNNLFLSADGTRVNLPPPSPPSRGVLLLETLSGLNKLDGFSTTGVIVSEDNPTRGALSEGVVAADSLADGTRFLRLGGAGAEPSVVACLDCTSSARPDGTPQSSPQELQFIPQRPLEERTTYAAVITTDLRNTEGRQVSASQSWAVLRLAAPLVDDAGRSQVSAVPDFIARTLEPVRQSLKPALDELEARGIPRARVALASVFRTQSTRSALASLTAVARTVPAAPTYVLDQSAQVPALPVPHDQLGRLYEAAVPVANLLTGPRGTIDDTPLREARARMLLTVPSSPMPAAGWPVVLFSHDLGGSRRHLLLIANELARAGFAAASLDAVHHGERSHCVGSRAPMSDDEACEDPATQRCELDVESESHGRCVARDPASRADCTQPAEGVSGDLFCARLSLGRCVSASGGRRACEGGTFRGEESTLGQPTISGWNMFSAVKPFATRDNFRQAAVDLDQLVRVLRSEGMAAALGDVKLDTTRLHLVGEGMGAMVGSLFLSVNDDVQRAVLNVPGADPLGWLLTSPGLARERAGYFSALQAEGLVPGTPAFDTFLRYQRQAFDPADPWNAARAVDDRVGAPAGREVFIQYITGNPFIPTELTEKFIAAANAGNENRCPVSVWDGNALPPEARHSFLIYRVGNGTVADAAQRQVAAFLTTGTVVPAPLAGGR